MKMRVNPLSRAHFLMPILFISLFISSLARTLLALPYSVVVNSNTLISSLSSHRRIAFLADAPRVIGSSPNVGQLP
jgi:hypothetical protein